MAHVDQIQSRDMVETPTNNGQDKESEEAAISETVETKEMVIAVPAEERRYPLRDRRRPDRLGIQ